MTQDEDVAKITKTFLDLVVDKIGAEELENYKNAIEIIKAQKKIADSFRANRNELRRQVAPLYEQFRQEQEQLQNNVATAVVAFSEYGWYANYGFSFIDITNAYILLRKGDVTGFDALMANMIRSQYGELKKSLLTRHPFRQPPLEAAFQAHESEEFYLSIPVFLAQADGISTDLTQMQFFLKNPKDHKPKVAAWAKEKPKIWLHVALCAALLDNGAFQKHHSQPNKIPITRHSILHGESNDYGTELNSLKALSLLVYLSEVLSLRTLGFQS